MVFHLRLSDSKSPQVSRTLLSILTNLNNDFVWMVSILPQISNSSSFLSEPFGTIPSGPITIGITVTLMFHTSFSSLARFKYLPIFFTFFHFHSVNQNSKILYTASSLLFFSGFFLLINCRFGLLRWCICISKSQRILCISFSRTDSGLWIPHLVVWLNFNLLHNLLWIAFPTQSRTLFVLVWCIHLLCD